MPIEQGPESVWLTAKQAADLLGTSERTVRRRANDGDYGTRRDPSDRRAPVLILLDSLPESARADWSIANPTTAPRDPAPSEPSIPSAPLVTKKTSHAPHQADSAEEYRLLWAAYERQGDKIKRRAEMRHAAVLDFYEAREAGVSIEMAEAAVKAKHGITGTTLWRYRCLVDGHPRGHWLPLLAPRYMGQGKEAEFTDEAYEWILARHLTTSETKTSVLVRLAHKEGAAKGWKIPSAKTVGRRLKDEAAPLVILGRQGQKALEASFPTVEKDYRTLALHELWESDGCRLNLIARWPNGDTGRPFVVVWRDVRSRLVLSAKGYKNPCGELVMVSFRDALENCGVRPKRGKVDNGREYANKPFTGRQMHRYRFKVTPFEPVGVTTQMDVKIDWAMPGRGRDKPIESFWRWVHENLDQRPEFQGAYVGKDALSKPEDLDPKNAVPIETLNALLAEALHYFNTQKPHRGSGMNGRTPAAVYKDLLPTIGPDRRPDPAHMRLLLMAVKMLKPDKQEATFEFQIDGFGKRRYWSEDFAQLPLPARDGKYAVWYHPEDPAAPVAIYDGVVHICDCMPLGKLPFAGAHDAAAAHVKAKNAFMKPVRRELKAIKAASPVTLPAPEAIFALGTGGGAPLFEDRRQVADPGTPEPVLRPTGKPGELVNRETGRILRRIEHPLHAEPKKAGDPAKLEALRQQQRDKNMPDRMRGNAFSPHNTNYLESDHDSRKTLP